MKHILLRCLLLLFVLTAALDAQAQRQGAQQFNPKEVASLSMQLDREGMARVSFYYPGKIEDQSRVKNALGHAFSFPLIFDPPRDNYYYDEDEPEEYIAAGQANVMLITARCAQPFTVQGMLSNADIHAAELAQILKPMGVKSLWVTVVFFKQVPHPRVTGAQQLGLGLIPYYQAKIGMDNPAAANVNISFGYRRTDIVLQSLPIIGFMIVPLMLIAWKSRSVLKLKDQPAEMWGSYFHFLGRILNWLWVIWIPVYAWSNVNEVVSASLGPKFGLGARALAQVFWLAPPILVMWLCHLLSRRVYRNVRGAEWSPADVVRRAIAGVTAAFIPFLMIIVVIETWGSGSRLTATLSIVAVLGSAAVARLITRSVRYSMYAATSGELRDRIFQLAQRAGVTLKQIYVLPEGKAQLSNAFARSDSSVMVTASLLRHLSKREVDVIMAHEIGHLKEKHPQRKAAVTFATLVIVNFLVVSFAPVLDVHRWAPVMLSLGLAGATAVLHFLSRSNERHADAIGVSLTGDPEAFISGLARMSRLNLMPMHGGRIEFGTHPKTLGRLQDIARVHGIGPDRLQALIAGEIAGEDHYAVNQTTESPAKIFSTAFKLKQAHRATLAILGTVILTPVLIATVLSQFRLSGPWYVIAYASGPIITGLLYLVVRNFLVGAGSQSIESQIRAKISAAGWPMAAREGWFVGLAPADCPRRYEKQTVWDLGLLWFSGNQMFYLGEETSFRLNRDEIRDARTGIIEPTLIPRNCVYVDYRDEMTSSDRTFYLVGAGSSILKSKRCTLALSERIMNWLSENSSVLAAEPNMNLAAPRFGVITSEAPKRKFQLVFALRGLMSLAILALPFCLVLRVSLAGMCYVLTMMTVIMLLDELPKLFYGRLMVHRQPQPPAYQPGSWIQLEAPARLQE